MLGSDLVEYLSSDFRVTGITKDNYKKYKDRHFDIVINANGNSKRFWANSHPVEDFIASTESVYRSIFDIKCGIYIYISSSDVYNNHTRPRYTSEDTLTEPIKLSSYGFHKFLSETIVRKHVNKYLVLRSSMILGKNLKKGPFYDIAHHTPLFISRDSRLQLITSREIANIIRTLLNKRIDGQVFNIGGRSSFSFQDIGKFIQVPVAYARNSEKQEYEMSVTKILKYYPLKTSEEYLRDFLECL